MQPYDIIHPISVSQLNQYLKQKLDNDDFLKTVCVEGEISNLTLHTSGHIYFTLKDSSSSIRAVMFRGFRSSLKFLPANGMHILLIGNVSSYEKAGTIQIYVQRMMHSGVGEVYLEFEQLKQKLEKEGLFDQAHKKAIPKYPNKICLVTSPTGAALQDMLNILFRRYPIAEVEVCATSVQGAEAVQEICNAITIADHKKADVILLARGGGSLEDLYVFNNEKIARAIYASKTPIITGIGHETDFTIADFVADLRAPTPSAAAELAVPNQQDILLDLINAESTLSSALAAQIEKKKVHLLKMNETLIRSLSNFQIYLYNKLQERKIQLKQKINDHLKNLNQFLQIRAISLSANNPLAICAKGYGRLQDTSGKLITSISQIALEDKILIYLPDGHLTTIVIHKEKKNE